MIKFLLDPSLILTGIIIFLAIKNRNSYSPEASDLSFKWKVLVAVFILICLPAIIFPVYTASIAYYVNHTDYWYKKASAEVDFHLYEIKPPPGLVIDSVYKTGINFNPELNGAVQTVINTSLREQLSGKTALVIVKQVGVGKDYDMENFLSKTTPASSSANFNQVLLSPSTTKAYLHQPSAKVTTTFNPKILYFVTPDHVIISISTPDQSLETLYKVANSFFPSVILTPAIVTQTPFPTSIPTPTPIIDVAGKPSLSKFVSSGTKTLEAGITAQMTSVSVQASNLVIGITFTNTASSSQNVAVIRLSMYSQTLSTSNKENIFSLPLSSGQSRSISLSYKQIANSPYTWKYATSSGGSVELGTYTP